LASAGYLGLGVHDRPVYTAGVIPLSLAERVSRLNVLTETPASSQEDRSVMGLLYESILYDIIYCCMYLLSGSHYLSSITDSTRVVK
jgi:hypothetical protein